MQPAETNIAVDVRRVSKDYGKVNALKEISLSVADKEFFTLLGPSGCGKTTLLRIVAGFESVSAGTIHLYGDEIADLPANKRPVNTVFQQYSLFPHMTVAENVKFGLQMKRASSSHIEQRTRQMLELVQLGEFADRKSTQLSGGQQQRVALARALAPQPQVLLLDEPLSALDLKLRQAMRVELKQIQQETGITFVFVTHDQEEALTMSDRIAIMSDGEVQQVGTAEEIYREPLNRFVADFIGESNLLATSVVESSGGVLLCELSDGNRISCKSSENTSVGTHGMLCIRPERLVISATDDAPGLLHGIVERLVFLGTDTQIGLRLKSGEELLVRVQNSGDRSLNLQSGQAVSVAVDRDSARFLAN